jgi:hypothetical protein
MRPLTPDKLKYFLQKKAEEKYEFGICSHKQRGLLAGMVEECLSGDRNGRYAVCAWLTGESSSSDIPDNYVLAMLDWLGPEKGVDGRTLPNEYAIKEAQKVLIEALKEQGQQELF